MTTYICRTITRAGAPCPPFLVRAREPLEAVAKASLRLAGEDYRIVEIWAGEKRVVTLTNPGIPKSRYLS
ncbi:MAG: hypothetical protein AB7I36_11655 [Rhodospirillaceae bacterium]